jgi:hypothetical protein
MGTCQPDMLYLYSIIMPVRLLLLFLLGAIPLVGLAAVSDTVGYRIDIRRVKLHEDIDRIQAQLLETGGKKERLIRVSGDEDVNLALTDILIRQLDLLQDSLETTSSLDHRLKVKYLSGVLQVLRTFQSGWLQGSFEPEKGLILFAEFSELMAADRAGQSIEPIMDRYPYETSDLLINTRMGGFFDNSGYNASRISLFRKFCTLYPSKILPKLENYADVPFADSLLRYTARLDPNQFYDYAAATETKVGQLIRNCEDPLVKAITVMASSNSGRLYYPFLDEVMKGRLTLDSINKIMVDSLQYYRLLATTQIEYARRLLIGDTALGFADLTKMLQRKAVDVFINRINALHDDPDPIRFRILEPLTPEELYYLIVLGEDVIYTSSYKGVYNRMMDRMRVPSGDTLLMRVQFDRFKKFIKMAAGYNKLESFLATMPDSNAQRVMIAFARGLEKSGQLEDAVDVADSYGSITMPAVKAIIDREVSSSLENSRKRADHRSETIYQILQTIFASSSDTSMNLSELLGIPPVYSVDYTALADTSGKVVQLVFFYGDKDGIDSYANFMTLFNGSPEWKITRTKEWVEIRSAKGKPVVIYANLPLDNSKGDDPDAAAQASLLAYLKKNNLQPTIVIHRGHSYHVKYTIRQLPASARIVVLGSCGGYHNLDDVLNTCPDAHIISSKEVGTRIVNEPILRHINDDLKAGRSIDWIGIWRDLAGRFTTGEAKERFENYIPPHRNLGALFIKAYQKAMVN